MGRSITTVALAVVVLLALPGSTLAAGTANCSEGGQVSRWRGQSLTDSGTKHGTSGTAEAYTLAQCTNPGLIEISGSFYFSNVTPNNGGFSDIVQIGMGNCRAANCVGGMR